ncbi:MAG: translocation/assembly module TamB domain-containing protein [Chitinophagaceae bacterium]|nr:translocation/assembly module TamB domain-containing protein [Chitinophagaceae bacterium]
MLLLLALIVVLWLALQTSPVQNWLARKVTKTLSENLQTTVKIDRVDFTFFDKMHLEGTLILDRSKDTLLYAGDLQVNITDWFFFYDDISLNYVGLRDATIYLNRNDSIWNYQFLIDYFSSGKQKKEASQPISLDLKKLEFENVHLVQRDAWRGEDKRIRLGQLSLDAETFSVEKKEVVISAISLIDPLFTLSNYEGNRPPLPKTDRKTDSIKNDPNRLRWNPEGWSVRINEVSLKNGGFKTMSEGDTALANYFDGSNIHFYNINGTFKDIQLNRDSITGTTSLRTEERSGLQVTQLKAAIKFHPEAMEFADLDLRTPRSRLHNFFAMRYRSFSDFGDFLTQVNLEANFNDADLSSDDIAYFAPTLKDLKKKIRVDGKIKGTIEDLQAKNLEIEAGNSTYLNGDIRLTGLPDINKTYIDFDANSFRTTYSDAIAIIPELKNVSYPRLDLLQFLRFKGNFTGFINDFVTYGTIETNLGTVVSDLNMKFPANANTRYSGTIQTRDFELGKFLETAGVGKITFKGNINGNGLSDATLNAKLDGFVEKIEANNYTYTNITVKGTVAKKLFNGELISNDPNLDATLNGLVDFSQKIPRFDFNASIAKADFKRLSLTKDDIQFAGKFRFDFSGNDIDNFMGTARIYEANVLRNGNRIAFDSLFLESKVLDNNKVITVLSNEFDAALVGEFSINELPAAFQTFLNKYFPSYINPSRKVLKNENFSFVITTKNVQDYIDLFVTDLKGFNYSTITGRINNKENLLDLNAEVPQFSYKNIALYNVALKGSGNMQNLTVETNIGDVYINDSLHFPGTAISIKSANDTSDVRITTSANQTLNSANLSAKVNTRKNGISILFNESNFDINGKNWTIDKDGELVLSKDLVSAEGVKIYNGQQEIRITTVPSDIGNTNDIKVDLTKINIGDFAPYVVRSNRLEGLLTATVDIIDPFGKLLIDVKGDAEQFRLDDDSIGRVQLGANYNQRTGVVNFTGISNNRDYRFDLSGLFNTLDSTSSKQLDILVNLDNTKIDLLERYLSSVFSDLTGLATGKLRIAGSTRDLKYLGDVSLKEAKLKVNYTNVTYTIPEATFAFKEDLIDFGSFSMKDTFQNSAVVTKGRLRHKSFREMDFDFAMNSPRLLVLNTNSLSKDPFYGNVIARTNLTFSGPMEDMMMNVKAEPADSSELFIRSGGTRESGLADFIVWKTYGREMDALADDQTSKLTLALDITANNLVKMNVILDELTKDVMTAVGHGNLKLRASTAGEFNMTGQYDIDQGNYNFNFQSLLRKPFTLLGEGSFIRWTGGSDPTNADLNVMAEYEADNVKFSDLGDQLYAQGGDVNYIKKYRGKVKVLAHLTGKLLQPDIKFSLKMPDNSPLRNDPIVVNLLKDIQTDENELNKQVAFLLIFNSFGPKSTSSQNALGSLAAEGIISNSISGFISNQLDKVFSNAIRKVFNDESIKVNFNAQFYNGAFLVDNSSTGGDLSNYRTNVNFSLARSVFNERLTFTFGSALDFGIPAAQANGPSNFQFLPDLTAELKLRPDGKLLLTFFYRDSYNYQSASGKQNRSGAGISYRRDFENLSDLFRKERKKKKLAPMPVAPVANPTSTN